MALFSVFSAAVGCGAGASPAPRREVVHLDEVVPEGYSSLLRMRPRALFTEDATLRVALAIIPSERLDALRDRHGVDPRELELLSLASYDDHSVWVARGPFHAAVVVSEIGHRMAPLESSADTPVLRRAGIYRMHSFELLALGPHDVAVVDGPPELAGLVLHTRQVALSARGAAESARHLSRLQEIVRAESDAPFLFVLHGRPDLPPEGIGLLLARLEDSALAIAPAGPSDPGALELRARLFGELPPGADGNLRTLISSLSEADLGRAVGLEEVARTLTIDTLDREIRLTARVRASTLSRGLRVLFGAEIEDLLDAAR